MAAKVLKLLCVFFATVTVLLCGCVKRNEPDPPNLDFQADFTAEYRGLRPAGSLTAMRQGICTITFTAQPTLSGLQIRCRNGTIALICGDAAATADEPYLPDDSFPSLLCAVLDAAGNCAAKDGSKVSLTLPSGEATLTIDDRQLPSSAAIPSADFAVSFSHCKPLG